nr:MAG TPA: hypothetical protein [Caudoviricetes sp.]
MIAHFNRIIRVAKSPKFTIFVLYKDSNTSRFSCFSITRFVESTAIYVLSNLLWAYNLFCTSTYILILV